MPHDELTVAHDKFGTVLCNYGGGVLVEDAAQRVVLCKVRKSIDKPVAGDRVEFHFFDDTDGVVEAIVPRSNEITRPDKYGKLKTLAANISQMLVVAAVRPVLNEDLIDRYLVAAEALGVAALIVLNKVDMADDIERKASEDRLLDYVRAGYPCVPTTATQERQDIHALKVALQGQVSILVGQSGVGKSSLARAILGNDDIRIGPLSLSGKSGTHTTTETTLYRFEGGALIDSPGVREYRLWNMDVPTVTRGFREFRPLLGSCRFNDCRHRSEPGCAIISAVHKGEISERRWQSYLRIVDALPSKAAWEM